MKPAHRCEGCGAVMSADAPFGHCPKCLLQQAIGHTSVDGADSDPELASQTETALTGTHKSGGRIGRYKLLERIGEGGCGIVYMAEQEEPVRRRVALKVIKPGMYTASHDKTARVWDAATGRALAMLAGHGGEVSCAQFSPDGITIVAGSVDKTARLWTVIPPSAGPPPAWVPDFLRYMAQMRLSPDGELETLKPVDWLALRERLRGVLRASADTPYLSILRKYVRLVRD